MIETRFPNRWFGSNPQAIPNHGKQLHAWSRELPKNWKEALEQPTPAEPDSGPDQDAVT